MTAGASAPKKVVVTGAGGRTGGLVFKKLLGNSAYDVVGMVRSEKSAKKLKKSGGTDGNIAICDVTDPTGLGGVLEGASAVVLCTSAVPKIYPFSILKIMFKKLTGAKEVGRPKFHWCPDGEPEKVDWLGAKAQIDAAKAAGVGQFIFVSSMGGTQPDNFLNSIGKQEDGTAGDILLWKRKAEKYLLESGVPYTIVHPGGLLDKEGGVRALVVGINDTLLKRENRSVPRADVAEVCVQALGMGEAMNRSFDLASELEGEGEVTKDFAALIGGLEGDSDYSVFQEPPPMAKTA